MVGSEGQGISLWQWLGLPWLLGFLGYHPGARADLDRLKYWQQSVSWQDGIVWEAVQQLGIRGLGPAKEDPRVLATAPQVMTTWQHTQKGPRANVLSALGGT